MTSLYDYVGGDPVNFVDVSGLETIVITIFDSTPVGSVGSHSAVYISNSSMGTNALYDPAGSYIPEGELGRGSSDVFYNADLQDYINFHYDGETAIDFRYLYTTPEQELLIEEGFTPNIMGGFCASAVSGALGQACNIEGSLFPEQLFKNVKKTRGTCPQ